MNTVISRWAAVSPFGIGSPALRAGVRERRGAVAPLDRERWPAPVEQAGLVPDFDIRDVLGPKGTRTMDRISALAAAATGELLHGTDGARLDGVGTDAGLVLGVNHGSAQSIADFTRDSLVKDRPYFVNPAHFPNTVMNVAAATCGIRYQLRGPNVTLAGGRSSALLALNYARRLVRAGRAEAVLCGAAEEFSVTRAWLESHTATNPPVLGEGCAMLLVEPRGRAARYGRDELAEVLAVRFGVFDSDPAGPLRDCVRGVLDAAAVAPEEIWAVAAAHDPELAAAGLGFRPRVELSLTDLVGDTQAASAALGLAAVLALAAEEPAAAGRMALVSTVDRDGTVGCALLRLCS